MFVAVLIFSFYFCCAGLVYLHTGGRWLSRLFHDVLHWHVPCDDCTSFDGTEYRSVCGLCGKRIYHMPGHDWEEARHG